MAKTTPFRGGLGLKVRGVHRWGVAWLTALVLTAFMNSVAAQAPSTVVRYGVYQNEPKIFVGPDGAPAGIFVDLLT